MIGEAVAAACGDRGVLARLAGPLGEAARAAADQLAGDPVQRRARRAAWAAAARAAVPPGIRGVHATWIEAGLAGLPARARDDLARGGGDPVAVWLARVACAELAALPPADLDGPPRSTDEAIRLPGGALASWLAAVGADQLALALGPVAHHRAVAPLVGDRLARATERIVRPPRAGGLGPVRAAIGRARGTGDRVDDRMLVVIGARAIAAHVGALAARQLAVRLPRELGLVVRGELLGHARAPVDQAPTWGALAAPY